MGEIHIVRKPLKIKGVVGVRETIEYVTRNAD
jgi:hypothetical protein